MARSTNTFKAALREGRLQIGLWQALANPYTAELCAGAGYDWLLLDGEHGPNDLRSLLDQLQAVSGYPVHAVARPPAGEAWLIKQYLDIGFATLLVPLVETAAQAATLVSAMRYPPQWADEEVCLLVQVETSAALANLDAIASTDGVDGVFIGPADLCASLGHRGNPAHPEVKAEILSAIATVQQRGKAVGLLCADEVLAREYIAAGCAFVAVGTDVALFARGVRDLSARFRPDRKPEASSGASAY
jgi:4-hydroxy-2-oxoheptanedioate aldolase